MTTIAAQLQHTQQRLQQACHAAGRPEGSVRLLAVSKTFGPDAVAEAVQAGQRAFGENYVQEGVDKIAALLSLFRLRAIRIWACCRRSSLLMRRTFSLSLG